MDIKGKRLRLLFSDVLGVERGKYLFGDVADAGHSAFCVGVFPLTTDKEILDVSRQQFDVGLPDVEAFIDRDTLRPGWEEDTIVGIADVQQHGKALEVDPREVLPPGRRAVAGDGARADVRVRVRVLPARARPRRADGSPSSCRRIASTAPARRSTRRARSTRWSGRRSSAGSRSRGGRASSTRRRTRSTSDTRR
jgi:hypothetical protein